MSDGTRNSVRTSRKVDRSRTIALSVTVIGENNKKPLRGKAVTAWHFVMELRL
jgi:hypothetical protein